MLNHILLIIFFNFRQISESVNMNHCDFWRTFQFFVAKKKKKRYRKDVESLIVKVVVNLSNISSIQHSKFSLVGWLRCWIHLSWPKYKTFPLIININIFRLMLPYWTNIMVIWRRNLFSLDLLNTLLQDQLLPWFVHFSRHLYCLRHPGGIFIEELERI